MVVIFSRIDYHKLARLGRFGLTVSLIVLLLVPVVGITSGGASRWLQIGAFGFQPSDLAKLALILYIGVLLTRRQTYVKSLSRPFVAPLMLSPVRGVIIG